MTGFATNIAEAYEGAIDILERRGWCQKDNVNSDKQVCAEEAIGQACGLPYNWWGNWSLTTSSFGARYELVEQAIDFHRAKLDQGLFNWNDEPGRTALEVRDRLMECAKLAREEGV